MGMFDDVECEFDLPDGCGIEDRQFQTKSLYRALDQFAITKGGRLILRAHKRGLFPQEEGYVETEQLEDDRDMNYHGDIRLLRSSGGHKEFVARFTHGQLEWIRPIDEFSQDQRLLLP